MSHPQWPLLPADLASLLYQHYTLLQAITALDTVQDHLIERYIILNPNIVDNHLVSFHSRSACTFAFSRGTSAYVPAALNRLSMHANSVAISLVQGQLNKTEWSFQQAEAEIDRVEEFLLQQ